MCSDWSDRSKRAEPNHCNHQAAASLSTNDSPSYAAVSLKLSCSPVPNTLMRTHNMSVIFRTHEDILQLTCPSMPQKSCHSLLLTHEGQVLFVIPLYTHTCMFTCFFFLYVDILLLFLHKANDRYKLKNILVLH